MVARSPASLVRVWDPWVRVAHWSVATCVVIDLFNEAGANPWHGYLGYAAGALVVARLAWGIVGSRHARLSSMARSVALVGTYVSFAAPRTAEPDLGHNPLGACMAFTLWGLILIVVTTGWLLQLEALWGNEALEALHTWSAYGLGACAVVHVCGVLVTSALR